MRSAAPSYVLSTAILAALLVLATSLPTSAQGAQKTWSNGIASMVYAKCSGCHHEGGIGPFPLMSYDDAVQALPYGIDDVSDGTMPPWPPDNSLNTFAHPRSLSSTELSELEAWVQGGMPRGEVSEEPAAPNYSNGITVPLPIDATVRMPNYTSTAVTRDVYRNFVIPLNNADQLYIRGFEVLPGNGDMVHHVLVFADTTGDGRRRDNEDAEPGFDGQSGDSGDLIGVWAPGAGAYMLPKGFGFKLGRNVDIILQIHYPAGTNGRTDSTRVALFYEHTRPVREVTVSPLLNHGPESMIEWPFVIAANTTRTMHNEFTVPTGFNATVLAVAPHMHLIGRSIRAVAVLPSSTDTVSLINIPEWDFHWQGSYFYKNPLRIPARTRLLGEAFYDNTPNNPHNPSNPPVTVRLGEATTDEMFLIYFTYTAYRPGDEDLDLEELTSFPTSVLDEDPSDAPDLRLWPNPSREVMTISRPGIAGQRAEITTPLGQRVWTATVPDDTSSFDISFLARGCYVLRVGSWAQTFVKE